MCMTFHEALNHIRIGVLGGGYMCHMRRRIHVYDISRSAQSHTHRCVRRRIHVSYEEEDTCV